MSSQQNLFDTAPSEWELDAERAPRLLATVVFADGPPGEFDYLVPDELADPRHPQRLAEAGRRVRAPLGRGGRRLVGYCVATRVESPQGGRALKPLDAVVDPERLVSPAILRLTRWMAERYLTPWGQTLEAVVPKGVRGAAGTREVTLLAPSPEAAAGRFPTDLPAKQRAVLEAVLASPSAPTLAEVLQRVGCTSAPVTALRKRGLLAARTERREADDHPGEAPAAAPAAARPALTAAQQAALETIRRPLDQGRHETILLHGVTGSGKTEVYLRAIERVLSFGRQAIVLVPEISLTPQTVGRFRERFGRVEVLHSHLTDVERRRAWRRIERDEAQVVVGARSAVFAPTRRLGLVVLDEEHESSFKQDTSPRYHAREVALERTRSEGAPLVLGSATPSLESWVRAQPADRLAAWGVPTLPAGERYTLATMPDRIGGLPMPAVRVVDLAREQQGPSSRGALSRSLHQAMGRALADGGQIILLLNRRGHSTHLQCPRCREAVRCERCDVSLTFHRGLGVALCHWCDYSTPPPSRCPQCGEPSIRYLGLGTERLEAEVRARFPGTPVARMDADTTRGRGSHQRALDAFRRGETRILLGTQMIAKGLDFPDVTLVGVVSADAAANLPDFRAAERTFQLVTQVAGRTGRGPRGGSVVVQALDPEHPAIRAARTHDYRGFAVGELPARSALGYPPYTEAVRVVSRGRVAEAAREFLAALAARITTEGGDALRLRGPAPAPIPRLREAYRFQLLVLADDGAALRAAVAASWAATPTPRGVEAIIDVDPMEML